MAWEKPGHLIALKAAADLRTSQYMAVDVDSSGNAALPGSHARAIGVLQNKPNINQTADVMTSGVTKMVCAGNITQGLNISVDTAGKAVATATGYIILGIALDAGSAGKVIAVLLLQQGVSA